ncbi:MAG: hypothetical protein KY392_02835 [Chloroflexi bacterium]|nr:hypothetical protein [Chloroflexota bacterium]
MAGSIGRVRECLWILAVASPFVLYAALTTLLDGWPRFIAMFAPFAVYILLLTARDARAAQRGGRNQDSLLWLWFGFLLMLSPLLALFALAAMLASAHTAAASRLVARGGLDVPTALLTAPRALLASGAAGWTHTVATFALRAGYVAFAALLLRVLWAPIGAQLAIGAGFGVVPVLLLVGFVAIWLCLVLGGGALRAWSSETWTRVLEHRGARDDATGGRPQGEPHRP